MNKNKEKLFKSKGWQAINRIGAFAEMHHIFIQNYQDLMNIISQIQNPQIEYKSRVELMLHNVNRYIFNFISSAMALRDNSNEMIKAYQNTILGKSIEENIKKFFANNLEIAFIQKYRNIHTHKRLVIAYLSDDDKILWNKQSLLEVSQDWNGLSKKYINNCSENVALKDLFEAYFETINNFYNWLYPELLKWHKQDALETIKIAAELKESLPKIYFDIINTHFVSSS